MPTFFLWVILIFMVIGGGILAFFPDKMTGLHPVRGNRHLTRVFGIVFMLMGCVLVLRFL